MAPGKTATYKAYLDAAKGKPGDNPVPKSTWRRWLQTGKITVRQLQDMGYIVNVRQRRKAQDRRLINSDVEQESCLDDSPDEDRNESRCSNITTSSVSEESDVDNASSDISLSSLRSSQKSYVTSEGSFSSVSNLSESETSDIGDEGEIPSDMSFFKILNNKYLSPNVLNQQLHPNLSVTKFEVILMLLHLSMRHRMTDVFIQHQLEVIDAIVGIPNSLGISARLFQKLFQFGRKPTVHFFCPKHKEYLGTEADFPSGIIECSLDNQESDEEEQCQWSSTVSSHNDGNFYLTLPLREQLRDILTRPGNKFVSKVRLPQVVSDMMDGKVYKSHSRKGKILDNENALTLTINTDSSPVFKSGPNSLWPVHLYINEFVPSQRFCADNILLGGLWFGKSETNLDMFLKPIVQELLELEQHGVIWQKPDGLTVESPVYVMCCCCDSVARPKVQHHKQFNGSFGCTICLHPNTSITVTEKVKQGVARPKSKQAGQKNSNTNLENVDIFKTTKTLRYLRGDYMLRSNQTLRDHMKLASVSAQGEIYGSTGESVLCDLRHFDVVYGFAIDYMHAILLGTIKKMANLWFDSSSSNEPYYIGLAIGRVDRRLAFITLPSGFRPPRPMSDRTHWKANEWRAFLLYFALPVLLNILPQEYYNNLKKLVVAIYTLTKESILYDEIDSAQTLLREFVWEFQDLYGQVNMVFNIHITSHIADVVAHMGPLWAFSAFPFESANGRLVKLAMGTKGVATQICRKFLMTKSVCKLLSNNYEAKENIIELCCNIIGYKYLKNSSKGSKEETLLGREHYQELTDVQKQAFIDKHLPASNIALVVNRAVMKKKLYHGRQTTNQRKACDSCIRLISGEYALIDLIIINGRDEVTGLVDVQLLVTKLNVATEPSPVMVSHMKQCCLDSFGDVELITADEISRKCIFFSCNDKNYVSEVSNFYETD